MTISKEKELFYDNEIEKITASVPKSESDRSDFLDTLKNLINEDDSEVSFDYKIEILHTLSMFCESHLKVCLPYHVHP